MSDSEDDAPLSLKTQGGKRVVKDDSSDDDADDDKPLSAPLV